MHSKNLELAALPRPVTEESPNVCLYSVNMTLLLLYIPNQPFPVPDKKY